MCKAKNKTKQYFKSLRGPFGPFHSQIAFQRNLKPKRRIKTQQLLFKKKKKKKLRHPAAEEDERGKGRENKKEPDMKICEHTKFIANTN